MPYLLYFSEPLYKSVRNYFYVIKLLNGGNCNLQESRLLLLFLLFLLCYFSIVFRICLIQVKHCFSGRV